ncbi:MAG: 50S ribosomal protein L21 [Bacteroidetes bacterium]|nr:50S ribosomal protein L21 [Bacteroidota bacterium]MCH8942782.1 50S ribosomal protein L21 [Bacteroidota bacterium]
MYAVVDIAGHQFKVTEKTKYYVPKLNEKVDSKITFNDVLMVSDDKKTNFGAPFVKGAKVSAKILEHLKDDKVIVFKKKRRTGYQKSNGHRQQLTRIEITKIALTKEIKATKDTKEVKTTLDTKVVKEPKAAEKTKIAEAKVETKETK